MAGRIRAAGCAVVLLTVLGVGAGCGGDEGNDPPVRDTAPSGEGRTRLSGARVDKTIRLPGEGSGEDVTVGEGAVWVLLGDGSLARVDPATGESRRVDLPTDISRSAAAGHGSVWVTDVLRRTVTPVDADTLRPGKPIKVGRPSKSLLFGPVLVAHGRVWVADADQRSLWTIDPATKRVEGKPIKLESSPSDLAASPDGVWAAIDGDVVRVDSRSRRVTKEVFTGGSAGGLAFGEGALWLISVDDEAATMSVEKVDPESTDTQRLDVPTAAITGATDVVTGFGGVWATDVDENEVVLLRPGDLERIAAVPAKKPYGLAVDRDSVWVAAAGQGALLRVVPSTGG